MGGEKPGVRVRSPRSFQAFAKQSWHQRWPPSASGGHPRQFPHAQPFRREDGLLSFRPFDLSTFRPFDRHQIQRSRLVLQAQQPCTTWCYGRVAEMMVISDFISCQKSSSSSFASATGSGTALPPHRDARGPAARGQASVRAVGRSLCRPRLGLPVAWGPLCEADSAGPSRVECGIGARAGEPSGAAGMSSERPCRPAYCLVGGRAQVAKLVDAAGLGPAAARCGGSIPFLGTIKKSKVV